MEEELSRSPGTSLCVPIVRYGQFLGMGLLASSLILSTGHAQQGMRPENNGQSNHAGNDGQSSKPGHNGQTDNNAAVSNASTTGAPGLRADELAYDPQHGILLVINNADTPPFGTLISVNQSNGLLTVGQRLTFDTAPLPGHTGVNAQNGAEQPVWDPGSNRFYLSIPQIGGPPGGPSAGQPVPDGAIIRINPFTATVEAQYSVPLCGPAGLTLGPSPGSNGNNQGNQ